LALNDLNLSPTASRTKCAKICGDTMENYHPHGDVVIYPTLVRKIVFFSKHRTMVEVFTQQGMQT